MVIELIAPDGSAFRLKGWNFFDSANDVHQTYTLNLSREGANGTWRLAVRDAFGGDVGLIDTWTLRL